MIRGTTPDYILTVYGCDLTDKTVYVTIAQGANKITLTNDELGISKDKTGSVIAVRLTQEQTLGFREGEAECQIRYIDSDGTAKASTIARICVTRALLDGVITYAGNS